MLAQSCVSVCPKHLSGFVPCVAVEACERVKGSLVGGFCLFDSIVVHFLCFLRLEQHGCGEGVVGKPHKDAIEPYLITVDGFVPEDMICLGAGLLGQLFHQGLHGEQILGFGMLLIHACNKVPCSDVVKVVVFQLVTSDSAACVNHRVSIFLAVVFDALPAILQVGVEHGFEFDAHHVTPFGFCGEV